MKSIRQKLMEVEAEIQGIGTMFAKMEIERPGEDYSADYPTQAKEQYAPSLKRANKILRTLRKAYSGK